MGNGLGWDGVNWVRKWVGLGWGELGWEMGWDGMNWDGLGHFPIRFGIGFGLDGMNCVGMKWVWLGWYELGWEMDWEMCWVGMN